MKKKHLFAAVGLIALMSTSVAYAATSMVHDAKNDVGPAASYLDVTHAQVIEQQGQGTLLFAMQLGGPIPEAPSEAVLIWVFHVDTDPGAAPGGLYVDYIVRVLWSGVAFDGQVVNRATGAVTSGLPVSMHGRTVKVSVPLSALGSPSSFGWNAATRPGFPPVPYVDFAPDAAGPTDSSTLATWQQ